MNAIQKLCIKLCMSDYNLNKHSFFIGNTTFHALFRFLKSNHSEKIAYIFFLNVYIELENSEYQS